MEDKIALFLIGPVSGDIVASRRGFSGAAYITLSCSGCACVKFCLSEQLQKVGHENLGPNKACYFCFGQPSHWEVPSTMQQVVKLCQQNKDQKKS